jgi:hypothetical protein
MTGCRRACNDYRWEYGSKEFQARFTLELGCLRGAAYEPCHRSGSATIQRRRSAASWMVMNQSRPPYRSPMAWPAVILCTSSLCFSLWVALDQTTPQGFLARYGLVFLGIAMTAGATTNLLASTSRFKRWLAVSVWVCLAVSCVGLYLRTH